MNRMWIIFIMTFLLGHSWAGVDAKKKQNVQFPLNIDLIHDVNIPRSGAPIQLKWDLQWLGSDILEGQFEVELYDDVMNKSIYHYGIALTNDVKHLKTLHSYMVPFGNKQQITIHARFISNGKKKHLGSYVYRLGKKHMRYFTIGHCTTERDLRKIKRAKNVRSIKFEHFDPFQEQYSFTYSEKFEPVDLPVSPVKFTRFDIVVLDPYAFSTIRNSQWKSLLKWVSAGGSLWLKIAKDENSKQKELLNQLVAQHTGSPPFASNDNGSLDVVGTAKNWKLDHDLGKIWVDYSENNQKLNPLTDHEWRMRMIHLWKIRQLHADHILANGVWKESDKNILLMSGTKNSIKRYDANGNPFYVDSYGRSVFSPTNGNRIGEQLEMEPLNWIDSIITILMPTSFSVPPMPLLIFLACGYFMIIGPGDYYILGKLKKRWLTWVSFPLATILVTIVLVQVANSYMKTTREINELVIHDIKKSGEVIKKTNIQLILSSQFKSLKLDVNNGIVSTLRGSTYGQGGNPNRTNSRNRMIRSNRVSIKKRPVLVFDGSYPIDYSIIQNVSQWKPEFICVTSIPVAEAGSEFNWNSISANIMNKEFHKLYSSITTQFGEKSGFLLIDGETVIKRVPDELKAATNEIQALSLNSKEGRGLKCLFSRLSPSGAINYEDVSVVDQQDENVIWLIVVAPVESGLHVYRVQYPKKNVIVNK